MQQKHYSEVQQNAAINWGSWPSYELELYFALLMCSLLYCSVLIVKIEYDSTIEITHITTRPYKIALMIIVCYMLNTILWLLYQNLYLKGKTEAVLGYLIYFDFYFVAGWILMASKFSLCFIFILARTFEHASLLIFIDFQHALSL